MAESCILILQVDVALLVLNLCYMAHKAICGLRVAPEFNNLRILLFTVWLSLLATAVLQPAR